MKEQTKAGHRQRLRERFLAEKHSAYTEEALLELLLTYALPQRDVQPIARELLQKFESLQHVLDAELETLCQVKGIKSNSAVLLKLVHWLQSYSVPHNVQQTSREDDKTKNISAESAETPLLNDRQQHSPIIAEKMDLSSQTSVAQRNTGLFSKAMLKEAIALLPSLPETESLNEARRYLTEHLHYNAEQTRYRYAHYIIRRMFPFGEADQVLRLFAKQYHNTQALHEVCFYRFITVETLMQRVIEDVLLPELGAGQIQRKQIEDYLHDLFPSHSVQKCSQAIVDALRAGGVVEVKRLILSFGYRTIPMAAFAFVLHSEFPKPGVFHLKQIETSRVMRAMLWNPNQLLPSLYKLCHRGIISSVSETDSEHQFTTKWSLEDVVDDLTSETAERSTARLKAQGR